MTDFNSSSGSSFSGIHHYDVGYGALWDKNDLKLISKRFDKIGVLTKELKNMIINRMIYARDGFLNDDINEEVKRLKGERSKLVDSYEDQLERSFQDQTTELEPLEVVKKEDRVVASGMGRIAEFIVGESTEFFNHFAAGTGLTPVFPADTALIGEIARVSIEEQGYATASGAVVKYGAYFGPSVPTNTIVEAGVFDAMVNGVMLFRTVYPIGKELNHVQSITFFTLSHAIYQTSL